jgi:hypothetical protein
VLAYLITSACSHPQPTPTATLCQDPNDGQIHKDQEYSRPLSVARSVRSLFLPYFTHPARFKAHSVQRTESLRRPTRLATSLNIGQPSTSALSATTDRRTLSFDRVIRPSIRQLLSAPGLARKSTIRLRLRKGRSAPLRRFAPALRVLAVAG